SVELSRSKSHDPPSRTREPSLASSLSLSWQDGQFSTCATSELSSSPSNSSSRSRVSFPSPEQPIIAVPPRSLPAFARQLHRGRGQDWRFRSGDPLRQPDHSSESAGNP